MTSVISLIRHYQKDIERCPENETRVLRCLAKLHQLGVTVQHLQDTGVGRTVNALRKEPGEVGTAARALVAKWKHMVASAEESSEDDDNRHHSGRDNAEDSDHNANQSRDQEYESDHETGEYNVKSYNQSNGSYGLTKRHHEIENDDTTKKVKYGEDTSDDNEEKVNDKTNSNIDDCDSDSTSDEERKLTIKEEKKSDNDRDKHKSNTIYKETQENRKYRGESSKSESLDNHESDSQHRFENNSKILSGKSLHEHKEREKEKDSSRSADSNYDKKRSERHASSSEKRTSSSEKHKSSSERHKSSDKHVKSEGKKSKSTFGRGNTFEKTDKNQSKDKHSSVDIHKSSKYMDADLASNTHHQEKIYDKESVRSHKDKTKSHHNSSQDKVKRHGKPDESQNDERKHGNKENDVVKKSRNEDSSSKSKHSDNPSSHSSKNKSEKSSSSISKIKSPMGLLKEEKTNDKASTSSDKYKSSSSHKSNSMIKDDVPNKKSKSKIEHLDDDGIGYESGASFAEALGMVSPVKGKKKCYKDVSSPSNGSHASTSNEGFALPASLLAPSTKLAPLPPLEISALPEISPNYKPRPPPRLLAQPQQSEEDALNYVMSNKNQRTKIFSGNKSYGKVLSLYELCVNVIQEHIDALEYTGGVPYEILKPVVDRANPDQLKVLEYYNPYLMDDTNHLWQQHCEKKFRSKQRQEMETWREMYMRCDEDQEAKLKSLTANIKMAQDARNAPVKQTKMAYVHNFVKPPRNIARKQALHGTASVAVTSPAARVAALAGAGVVRAGTLPARALTVSHATASSSAAFKPKKAPLMAKALQLMRGRKR